MHISAYQNKQTITSEKDFVAINKLFKERFDIYNTEKLKITTSFRDSLFAVQKWTLENGTNQQKLIADFQVFFAYNQLIDNEKLIESGTKLLAKKDFLKLPESTYVAKELLSAYYRKGYYRKQLRLFPIFKELNKTHNYYAREESQVEYLEVAMIYYRIENYEKARENYLLQAAYFLDKKDFFRASSMYNNIGLTYEKQYNYKNAILHYNKSLDLLNKDTQKDLQYSATYKKYFKNIVASNIASLKVKTYNFEGVEPVFLNELKLSKNTKEPRITIQAYLNLGELYLLQKQFNLSKKYLDSSFIALNSYESPDLIYSAFTLKAKYLLSQQKLQQAQYYFQKSYRIKDSINSVKQLNNFEEASLEFNLDITQKELESSKNILAQKEITTFYQWLIIGVITFAGILFFFQFLKIKRKNKSILINRQELSKALKTNQTLLEEIHHRIKNNLQIIFGILELKSSKLKDETSIEVFRETQKYIESMSYIHEHLYAQDSKTMIAMQHYLENLTCAIVNNYNTKTIKVLIDAKNIILDTDNATPLGLIVCELVTNSAKHAFDKTGSIKITLVKEGDYFYFHYLDTGKGFDIDNHQNNGKIGMNLIDLLTEELSGKCEKYIDKGFNLKLRFK